MVLENRRPGPGNVEIDEARIDLRFDYNAEQLAYDGEIVDDIIEHDTDLHMLKVMAEPRQAFSCISSKSCSKNTVIQEDREIYVRHMRNEIEKEHIGKRCMTVLSSSNQLPLMKKCFSLCTVSMCFTGWSIQLKQYVKCIVY